MEYTLAADLRLRCAQDLMQARRIMVRRRLKTISRFLAWGCIFALAVLSFSIGADDADRS